MRNHFIRELPLLAILRGITPDEIISTGQTLIDAGFRVLEVPLSSPASCESISLLAERFGNDALIAAGTVLNPEEVARAAGAGARLIVSPNTSPPVIRETRQRKLYSIPGCCTTTEAFQAIEAGADALKLFPAAAVPPPAVKALRSVLPRALMLFVTGGIQTDSMEAYLKAGVNGFGTGSSLYRPQKPVAEIGQSAKTIIDRFKRLANEIDPDG